MSHKTKPAKKTSSTRVQPLKWVPESLASQTAICIACGFQNKPPWTTLRNSPFIPIKPKDRPLDDPGRWVPESQFLHCLRCGQRAACIDIPTKKFIANVFLYGDEAERFTENPPRYVFMYSFVGASAPILPTIHNAIHEVKTFLVPSVEPQTWSLHMKILTSGQKREKDPQLAALSREKINSAITMMFDILNSNKELWIYNLAILGTKNNTTKYDAYIAIVARVIDEITSLGGCPVLRLDSEKNNQADKVIHGWARDLFDNSQHSLLYAFLAKGIEIPEPEFVQPGSHPCLELADFVSYVIARYYHCRWNKIPLEWDPLRLGNVNYVGFEPNGDLLYQRCAGYPWDFFYGR